MSGSEEPAPQPRKPCILVADDNPRGREFITLVLASETWEIIEAPDGETALRLALRYHPDMILLDVRMPKRTGFEVLTELRQHPEFKDVPIVAITASAMGGDREQILAAGFTAYLPKPISPDRLRSELIALLATHRRNLQQTP